MADPQQNQDPPRRRFTDEGEGAASVIGREVQIKGTIRGATNLEIWGSFEGDMDIEGTVWLRPPSRFAGEIVTTNLVVEGELRGTVRATEKVDMRSTCRVEADVTANRVAAAEGSYIEGRITVAGAADRVVGYTERRER